MAQQQFRNLRRDQQIAIILAARRNLASKSSASLSGGTAHQAATIQQAIDGSPSNDLMQKLGIRGAANWVADNKGKVVAFGVASAVISPFAFAAGKAAYRFGTTAGKTGGGTSMANLSADQADAFMRASKTGDLFFQGGKAATPATFVKDIGISGIDTVAKAIGAKSPFTEAWRSADRLADLPVKTVTGSPLPHVALVVGKVDDAYLKYALTDKSAFGKALRAKLGPDPAHWGYWKDMPIIAQLSDSGRMVAFPTNRPYGGQDAMGMFVRPSYVAGDVARIQNEFTSLSGLGKKTGMKFSSTMEKNVTTAANELLDPFTKKAITSRLKFDGTYLCTGYAAKILQNAGVAKFTGQLGLFTANDLLRHPKLAGAIVGSGKSVSDVYSSSGFALL